MIAAKPPGYRPPSQKNHGLMNVLAACAAIGLGAVLVQHWVDRLRYTQAEALYHTAYCEAAAPAFQDLANSWRMVDLNDYQARSAARLTECKAFLAATASFAAPSTQLLAFEEFTTRFRQGPLVAQVRQRAETLVGNHELSNLATVGVCDRVDPLLDAALLPADNEPQLLMACGQTYSRNGQFEQAIAVYQRAIEDYPSHELAPQAETELAQTMVAQAKSTGAGSLPEPGFSGYTHDGSTTIEIRNDSPEAMRIVFSGPEARFEEIAPCPDCKTHIGEAPSTCQNQGTVARFTLRPGEYGVLVRSVSDNTVTPFTGQWALRQGTAYNSCFYLVQQPLGSEE